MLDQYVLYILTFVFLILQYLDYSTTRTILKNGGVEKNPIIKFLMDKFGIDTTLITKGILLTCFAYYLGTVTIAALLVMIAIYVAVICYNEQSMPK